MTAAQNMEELNLVAGQVAGSSFAYGQLVSSIQGLGLPLAYTASILQNVESQRNTYLAQLQRLAGRRPRQPGLDLAEGGAFMLTNAMNFGNNIRTGEQGTEIGVVLSNKVTQALRESRSGPAIGSVTIQSYENPRRAEYRQRRLMREELGKI
jgi:hypothetical protein